MKTAILILSLLLFSCAKVPPDETLLSDEKIRHLLIGTWVCAPTDSRCYPSRASYHRDGSLEFVRYKSGRCEIPVNETKALWRVENRKLIIVVQKSIGSVIFEPGLTTESEVVAISKTEKTLKANDEVMSLRIKSDQCVPVERE